MFELVSAIQTQIPVVDSVPWFQDFLGIVVLLLAAAGLSALFGVLVARVSRNPELAFEISLSLFLVLATLSAVALEWPRMVALLIFLAAAIGLSINAGNWIARVLKSPAYGWKLGLIFSVISVAGLAVGLNWPPKFGVDLRGGITIIGQLRQEQEGIQTEAVDVKNMIPQLIARVDPGGISEILIRALGTDKIEVVIPDVDMEEAMRIWQRLTQAGELKFRIVADRNYHTSLTARASELIEKGVNDTIVREKVSEPTENKSGKIFGRWYELGRVDPAEAVNGIIPFKFMPELSHLVRDGKTKQIISVQPFGGSPVEFAAWADGQKVNRVEILCVEPEGPDDILNVEGEHLSRANSGVDDRARPAVHFEMNRDGKRRMGALTSRNRPDGTRLKLLAIISDGKLITAPSINSTITDRGIIEGSFSQKEVDDLVINLKAGKLEVALSENPISQDYQQSTIGAELKRSGIVSCIIALAVVIGFICVYYRFGGAVASVVLLLNLLLVMAIVMIIKQPLTLTGLAGIVLTIGLSLDANVLIFERIREELKKGAALRMAMRNGYDRAMTTIIDSNLTTMFTGIVLYVIGTEQLKGFAVTLVLGILTSMFTATFCSRVILELAERRKWITRLSMLNIYSGRTIDFISGRHKWYAISLAVIVVGLAAAFYRGPEIFDHDLRGGSTARIVLSQDATLDVIEVRRMLNSYKANIGEREEVQFSVAEIDSTDFPGRVFKVDSNIPIWDKPPPAPFKPIDEALVEVFGNKLMQLHVNYDPSRLQISKVNAPIESNNNLPSNTESPANGGQSGDAETPKGSSGRNVQVPWNAGLALMTQPWGGLLLVQDSPEPTTPATQDPTTETKPAEIPAVTPANQDAAVETPAQEGQQPSPAQDLAQPSVSAVGVYVAKADLTFAQAISRGSLINALIAAAEKTNQVALDRSDIQTTAAGKNADDLSAKSVVWTVTLNIGRESDAKLILDSLQSDYNGKPYFPTISGVGGQIAAQTQWRALAAIIASLLGIILYVWVRFQNVAFGVGAVIALMHDVLVTIGAIALSYWLAPILGFAQVENFRISLPIIAAFLTIIGYSINDTIVVFDRIREVRGKRPELTAEMINISVSQTLSRTILTTALTLLAVLVLYIIGGDAIHGFAFALVVGMIAGTYSTVFIASPIALWLINRSVKHKTAKK